jgi:heme oxygenase
MESLLTQLRDATRASHATLDAAFGSLDLSRRDDYVRFLRGHAIGMAPLFASFQSFVECELGTTCPDYPAMLAADLASLDEAAPAFAVEPAGPIANAATGYVIAGSRLGLAMIRKQGYWGRSNELPSAYMEDDLGLAIWKEAATRLKALPADETEREAKAAITAFDTFREAFAASSRPL